MTIRRASNGRSMMCGERYVTTIMLRAHAYYEFLCCDPRAACGTVQFDTILLVHYHIWGKVDSID